MKSSILFYELFADKEIARKVAAAERGSTSKRDASLSTAKNAAGDIRSYACNDQVHTQCVFFMAMFFFTTFTPAQRIDNHFLTSALALRGVILPTRRQLMLDVLPRIYDEKYAEFLVELREYDGPYQIATDGWKRKAAERGVPLVNYVVTFPNGE